MTEAYAIMRELEDSDKPELLFVTESVTNAEQWCMYEESRNPGYIYYWVPTFIDNSEPKEE